MRVIALWDDFDVSTEWNARAAMDLDPKSDDFDIMRSPWGWFVEIEYASHQYFLRYSSCLPS